MSKGIRICCALAGALMVPVMLSADNIYKFQDENGIWHFTDRAPAEDTQFEIVFMEKEAEPRIHLRQIGTQENPVYSVFNKFWGPVEVEMRLSDAVNVLSEPPLPARFVIPGQKEQTLVGIGRLDQAQGFGFRIELSSVPGQPMPQAINNIVVQPPIAPGASYPISQGFQGEHTHLTPDSEYAVDIAMPVGSSIHAARAGRIMDVEEDFNRGGTNPGKYLDKANHIRILHDDGTMAVYAHLDLASVIVRPGARVIAGQKIARSGNTGFTFGPHLHFAIQQNTGMALISLPFKFQSPEGTPLTPEKLQLLKGPGGSY